MRELKAEFLVWNAWEKIFGNDHMKKNVSMNENGQWKHRSVCWWQIAKLKAADSDGDSYFVRYISVKYVRYYYFFLPNLQITFLRAFSDVTVITWMVILQTARAARHFNTRRERVDCFVNFYLFTPTRHYVFRTIVQDTHEFIVRDVFYYLFTIWILTV